LYAPHGFEQILPQGLNEALFFKHLDLKSILFTIFCLSLGLGIFIFKQQVIFITPLIMTSFLYPHALIVWAASGGDINRHAYQFRVQYRLVLILLSIVILGFIVEWIVKEYFSILEKRKRAILFSGIGLSVFSISADFLFNTGDTFSLGYAQIFLLLIGSFLIFGSTYLHLAPDKLKIGLGGELYESDNTKGV
jgi:hypothetical protein